MAFKYAQPTTNKTPATSKIIGRESEMVQNDGGGYSFKTTDFQALDRFLVIGADSGTYYISEQKNQYNNISRVVSILKTNGVEAVNRIAEVSDNGLAHKNDHAIFALSLAFIHGDVETRKAASTLFNKVIRTGTHLFQFCEYIKGKRGFGKLVRNAISNWYNGRSDDSFANQITKYQQREGWSHRDVLRLAHSKLDENKSVMSKYAFGLDVEGIAVFDGLKAIKSCTNDRDAAKIITKYGLQREHVPTHFLTEAKVQAALLPNMGATALLRNLGNFTKSGLLSNLSDGASYVCDQFNSRDFIKAGRLHPLSIMIALRQYASGHSLLGSGSWNPNQSIVDALEYAFYASFDLVEPTGKKFFYGIDVSGSMSYTNASQHMTCSEVAAILAMAHARTEKNTFIGGFGSNFYPLPISKKDSLETVMKVVCNTNFGSTNPSSAFDYAVKNNISPDCFIFLTDGDINLGMQPSQSLQNFNRNSKSKAKMVVCSLASIHGSICDPIDYNSLDIGGFSPEITSVIKNFVS